MTETPEGTTKITASVEALLNQVAQGTQFHFQTGLCGDWTLMAEQPEKAAIHLITEGRCWLGFPADQSATYPLNGGDVVFVNQGISHFISRNQLPTPIDPADIARFSKPNIARTALFVTTLIVAPLQPKRSLSYCHLGLSLTSKTKPSLFKP